jgi:quinol monooxygenase YgiN
MLSRYRTVICVMYRYVWKIKLDDPAREAEFLQHWQETSQLLQKYPGAKGTYAHRIRDEESSFFLVAQWESRADRDYMSNDIHNSNSPIAVKWRSFAPSGDFGEIIQFAGEEISAVLPEGDEHKKDT